MWLINITSAAASQARCRSLGKPQGPGKDAGCREPMSEHLTPSFSLYSDHVSGNLKHGGVSRKSGEKNIHDNCIQVQNNSGEIKEKREVSDGSGSISKKSQKEKKIQKKRKMAVGLDWYGESSWRRYIVIQEGSSSWVSTSSGLNQYLYKPWRPRSMMSSKWLWLMLQNLCTRPGISEMEIKELHSQRHRWAEHQEVAMCGKEGKKENRCRKTLLEIPRER